MMDNHKALLFFDAAIDKTKSGALSWSRLSVALPSTAVSLSSAVPYLFNIDKERSFLARYNPGEIALLRDSNSDQICCFVKADVSLSYDQVGEVDDPSLLRLYNFVYSQFPSTESFIDQFIRGF